MLSMGIKFKNFTETDRTQHIVLQCPTCEEDMDWMVHELDSCIFCYENLPSASNLSGNVSSRLDYHNTGE